MWDTAALVIAMQCDLCDRRAVVHETRLRHGLILRVNLCEEHAREAGLLPPYVVAIEGDSIGTHVLVPGLVPSSAEGLGLPPGRIRKLARRLSEELRRRLSRGRDEPPDPPGRPLP